jgi:hypothetical protein
MAKSIPTRETIRRLEGLGAAITGRLHAEARKLAPGDAQTLRRLAGQVAEDVDRLADDLRRGRVAEANQ